ncbi:MAG: ABC transporter ATP-binding protein [Alphaproteobacteria bacterium]|jgi:putative ABC transport system ATP-binding protein|nr:ABC transporter ATP-binding protein [Alphaproteobacteria bacterium]
MARASVFAAQARGVVMEFASGPDRVRVLHGVDMDLPYGRMTFLIGPSGSGKTTMLSILSGVLTPTQGAVEVMGVRLDRMSADALVRFRRRSIGFIFQQYNLVSALTAAENAAVPLIADGEPWGRATMKAKDLLDHLGLGDHLHKLPRQLSGGQQQRVAIARALVHRPALVVCDEPTAALDAAAGQAVMRLLVEAAGDPDRAVLVVTHDDRIYRYADSIVSIEDGRIQKAPQEHA